MGGFFSAVKTASYTAPKKRALNEMADIGRQIDGMLGNNNAALEQWGTWRNTFINGTDEEKKQTLREVMDNQQLPMGFRMAFLNTRRLRRSTMALRKLSRSELRKAR